MKRGLNILICTLIFTFVGQDLAAQFYRNQGYWKKYRSQVFVGGGASNFLGELGGRDQEGSDFIWDLETRVFKPAITLGYRYFIKKNIALRAQFSYAVVAGDDALTKERFRSNRNLHFRSNIFEAAIIAEYVFYEVRPGHRYSLEGVKGMKPRAGQIYCFAGIGAFRFNPQAKVDESWYDLRPLGTEGQNLSQGAEEYSRTSIAIPLGLGYRWRFLSNQHLFLGVEIGHRITFSDYIDDVSTEYISQNALQTQVGLSAEENSLAAYFADPSLGYFIGDDGNQTPLNSTSTGEQRGDPTDNDSYLFAQVTLGYTLNKQPYRRVYKKSKRGKRIVF